MTVLRLEVALPFPVELVWQALTDQQLLTEWFLRTDLRPEPGGVFRAFPTPGIPGFTVPFEMDVVEAVRPARLVLRWRGEELHSDVVWELSAEGTGCRLRVSQTGFLGIAGEARRAELRQAYELMFEQRLPALLEWLDEVQPAPPVSVPVGPPVFGPGREPEPFEDPSPRRGLLRRLGGMPGDRRLRLLSVAGAMVLTVLAVTALTTLLLRTPGPSAGAPGRGPGDGVQAGDPAASPSFAAPASPSASVSPTASAGVPVPSASAPPPPPSALPSTATGTGETGANTAPALSVSYRTVESFTGGYIGEITIRPGRGGLMGWTATIDLPAGARVTSAWDRIDFRQGGGRVTFIPQQVHRRLPAGQDFTFAFQVGDQSGATRPEGCAVNGTPCS